MRQYLYIETVTFDYTCTGACQLLPRFGASLSLCDGDIPDFKPSVCITFNDPMEMPMALLGLPMPH